jgi:hypothetical protein
LSRAPASAALQLSAKMGAQAAEKSLFVWQSSRQRLDA